MRHQHDEVKVAVCSAQITAPEEQRAQDLRLALLMSLSAAVIVGLRYYFF